MQREHHQQPLISGEWLSQLPRLTEVEGLGMNALARIRLCSHDAPFVTHLAGFDGTDMFFGLVIAHEIDIRLGHIHLSGLEAARQIWGVTLESACEHNTLSLWQGLAAHVTTLAASPYPKWDIRVAKRRAIYARLLANLTKEPFPLSQMTRENKVRI